jgi:foldase protein PrsA
MLKFKKPISLTIVLSLMMLVVSCNNDNKNSSKITDEGVKAIVNDKVISQEKFDENLANYKRMAETQYGEGAWDMEISEGKTLGQYYENEAVLDNMILEILLMEEAEKEGFSITEEELKKEKDTFKAYFNTEEEFQEYLKTSGMTEEYLDDSIKKEFVINKYLNKKIEELNPKDDELKTLYEDLNYGKEVRASHILVKTQEEANEAMERINSGDKFEDVAKDMSIDPSKENGGDLDFFPYTQMVKEFADAAFSMNVGDISDPVKSQFGFHVIKVTDKRTDETVTFESSKEGLTEVYKTNKYNELMENLMENATIEK